MNKPYVFFQQPPWQALPGLADLNNTKIAVTAIGIGWFRLHQQLESDISAKGLGWRPLPFTLFQLLDLKKLLPKESANFILTHQQRMMLSYYVGYYYHIAKEVEDEAVAAEYRKVLDAVLTDAMIISFVL